MSRTIKKISLEDYDGYAFEQLCAGILERSGYGKTTVTQKSGDGGKDIIVSTPRGETIYVECKHYLNSTVGRPVIQKLHSAMITGGATSGMVITSGKFSPDAEAYVQSNNIHIKLVDLTLLSILAQKVGISLSQGDEAITVYGHQIPEKAWFENTIKSYLDTHFTSSPVNAGNLITLNNESITLQPYYECEYDLDFILSSTTRVLKHDILTQEHLVIDGTTGENINPKLHVFFNPNERIPYNDISPNKWHVRFNDFQITETELRRNLLEQIKKDHTTTVDYYGKNNIRYSKTGAPSNGDIEIYNMAQVYIPTINTTLSIKNRRYKLDNCHCTNDQLYIPNKLRTCHICGKQIDKGALCNDCGAIVHSPRKYDSHSFVCESCGKTICRNCTYVSAKHHVCLDCAKKKGIPYTKLKAEETQFMNIALVISAIGIVLSILAFITLPILVGVGVLVITVICIAGMYAANRYNDMQTSDILQLPFKK